MTINPSSFILHLSSNMVHASDEFLILDDTPSCEHIEYECQDWQQIDEPIRMELALKAQVLSVDESYAITYPQKDEENAYRAEAHLSFPVLIGDDSPQVERTGDEEQHKQRPYPTEIPCAVGHHVPKVVHHRVAPHPRWLKIPQR